MMKNLEYADYSYESDLDRLETELIRMAKPPLNLIKWQNPQGAVIKQLRALCIEQAKSAWRARPE